MKKRMNFNSNLVRTLMPTLALAAMLAGLAFALPAEAQQSSGSNGSSAEKLFPSELPPAAAVQPVVQPSSAAKAIPASGAQNPDLVTRVKVWVKRKWTVVKSYLAPGALAPKPNPVAKAPVKRGERAIAAAPAAAPVAAPVASQAATAPAQKSAAPVAGVAPIIPQAQQVSDSSGVARIRLPREASIKASNYALDDRHRRLFENSVVIQHESPEVMKAANLKTLLTLKVQKSAFVSNVQDSGFVPKGKVSRESFDKIVLNSKPLPDPKLKKFVPLTPEEVRFLGGLLFFQKGERCSEAVGLFHRLSKAKAYQSEADYYLAVCSRKLGIESDFYERARRVIEAQDEYYAPKILAQTGPDIPYEMTEAFGNALLKASSNAKLMNKLDAKSKSDAAYILADFGIFSDRFKTALTWAKQVPNDHPNYLKAQFLLAVAEYHAGSKLEATRIQDKLIADTKTDKTKADFQALVALNLARMQFQEQQFKPAHENFRKVYKDHPLWLQSLTEFGWAQLQSGDFEGAIGNMYSVQSPFFKAVYKPESYVIRTVGYLNLCQYGDAYRALSILERDYRPYLDKMEKYMTPAKGKKPEYYQTVRSFFKAPKAQGEIDGLPMPVIREIVRHRDFTNLQKALNRGIDERPAYDKFDGQVEKGLKNVQAEVNAVRKNIETVRKRIGLITAKPELRIHRAAWTRELEAEQSKLNNLFFLVDLYNEAKASFGDYRKDVIGGADVRLVSMRDRMERVLSNRMLKMKVDLARVLDNNELLRYEVFAGSGENIRYQVAGGTVGNRVPATVLPKSKSLQWEFDGEYWEDEIGHYRSSLKNKCPENVRIEQAAIEGVAE